MAQIHWVRVLFGRPKHFFHSIFYCFEFRRYLLQVSFGLQDHLEEFPLVFVAQPALTGPLQVVSFGFQKQGRTAVGHDAGKRLYVRGPR